MLPCVLVPCSNTWLVLALLMHPHQLHTHAHALLCTKGIYCLRLLDDSYHTVCTPHVPGRQTDPAPPWSCHLDWAANRRRLPCRRSILHHVRSRFSSTPIHSGELFACVCVASPARPTHHTSCAADECERARAIVPSMSPIISSPCGPECAQPLNPSALPEIVYRFAQAFIFCCRHTDTSSYTSR